MDSFSENYAASLRYGAPRKASLLARLANTSPLAFSVRRSLQSEVGNLDLNLSLDPSLSERHPFLNTLLIQRIV